MVTRGIFAVYWFWNITTTICNCNYFILYIQFGAFLTFKCSYTFLLHSLAFNNIFIYPKPLKQWFKYCPEYYLYRYLFLEIILKFLVVFCYFFFIFGVEWLFYFFGCKFSRFHSSLNDIIGYKTHLNLGFYLKTIFFKIITSLQISTTYDKLSKYL